MLGWVSGIVIIFLNKIQKALLDGRKTEKTKIHTGYKQVCVLLDSSVCLESRADESIFFLSWRSNHIMMIWIVIKTRLKTPMIIDGFNIISPSFKNSTLIASCLWRRISSYILWKNQHTSKSWCVLYYRLQQNATKILVFYICKLKTIFL